MKLTKIEREQADWEDRKASGYGLEHPTRYRINMLIFRIKYFFKSLFRYKK
jgi:hypothetical protein